MKLPVPSLIAAASLALQAAAGTVSYTIQGVTKSNIVDAGDITMDSAPHRPWSGRIVLELPSRSRPASRIDSCHRLN